jgi:hypothetical protein
MVDHSGDPFSVDFFSVVVMGDQRWTVNLMLFKLLDGLEEPYESF